MRQLKALVTGGLGFIGSHLVDRLLSDGWDVVVVDDKSSHVREGDQRYRMVQGRICDVVPFEFSNDDIHVVFHLASFVGPAGILKHAGQMGPRIIEDAVRVIDFCMEKDALLIDVSTSEIYGHAGVLDESSEKVCPGKYKVRSEYAVGKLLSEIVIVNRSRINKVKYHIIRPFNVAGPRQKPDGGFVLPRFVVAALTDQPLTVFGDGSQRRAFTDVRDICDAIVTIAASGYKNEEWNIGNPKNEMTISDLAAMIIAKVEEECKIVQVDPKDIHGWLFEEAIDKIPYTRKIEDLLGWKAKLSIGQTIVDIIDFYREKIKSGYYFDMGYQK